MRTTTMLDIGDVPIFIAHDSVDVWAHRELFQLDEKGYPTYIAGVPVLLRNWTGLGNGPHNGRLMGVTTGDGGKNA